MNPQLPTVATQASFSNSRSPEVRSLAVAGSSSQYVESRAYTGRVRKFSESMGASLI